MIGKPLRKIDAMAKCAGETVYADDLNLPRTIYAKLLRSPHPHARVLGINAARALKLEGVFAVITGEDLPEKFGIMPSTQDEETLVTDKVRYVGDPVAAVAAASESLAETALSCIDVDYEVLKPILSIEEALAATDESQRIHTWNRHANIQKAVSFEFGDIEAGLPTRTTFSKEPFSIKAIPICRWSNIAPWGFMARTTNSRLWSSTQTPHYVHRALAKVLRLPASRIRVVATPVGGGFGGKSDPFSHEIAAAKLSMITRRPVKITLTREESFYVHRGRHPVKMWAKTGVKNDGTIQAMQYKTYLDGGGYSSYGLATVYYTGALQTVTYNVPAYKFEGVRVFTNKPACGPKRGHGTPQPRFALEIQLDEIAEKLGIDPIDLRLKQLVEPNTTTINGLAGQHHRAARMHRAGRRARRVEEKISQAAFRSRRRLCRQLLHQRRRPADLLERHAALRRADQARPQRRRHSVLRLHRYRTGIGFDSRLCRRRRIRHRSRRHQGVDRGYGSDAGGSRQLFEPRHRNDRQRRHSGLRQAQAHAARSGEQTARSPDRTISNSPDGKIRSANLPSVRMSFGDAVRKAEGKHGTLGATGSYWPPKNPRDFKGSGRRPDAGL